MWWQSFDKHYVNINNLSIVYYSIYMQSVHVTLDVSSISFDSKIHDIMQKPWKMAWKTVKRFDKLLSI